MENGGFLLKTERLNFEDKEKRENITSKINLRFFRHADKESSKEKPDEAIELNETGKRQAVGTSRDSDISQSVAFGSPRKRTQQTAGLVMSGLLAEIKGDETVEGLKEKVDRELKVGSKIGIDKRLDFNIDFSTDFGKKVLESAKNGRWLKFLVEESDKIAEEFQDNGIETYSIYASRVAEIVKKYLSVASRWDALVQDETKNYHDTLKRFFGTHQGIAESFLAKVIEQTKGKNERDVFVSALSNQGFDFVEGFEVEIDTINGEEQKMRLSFKKEKDGEVLYEYSEIVPAEIIDNMILKEKI